MKLILYTLLAASLLAGTKKENRRGQPELTSKQNCESYYDSTLRQKIYITATTEPTFGNSSQDLFKYILDAIKYPPAQDISTQSKAIAEFIVDSEGKMHRAAIIGKKVSEYSPLDRSLLEVLRKMPQQWSPGKCDGVNIAFLYRLPMQVCLSK